MIYEEKKANIIQSIVDSLKLRKDTKAFLYTQRAPLDSLYEDDIQTILLEFQNSQKLQISDLKIAKPHPLLKNFHEMFDTSEHYIEITNVDLDFFQIELAKYKSYLEKTLTSSNEFFIFYSSDRRILLNGKIELATPDFDTENERIFTYLYSHKNEILKIKEIKEVYEKNYKEKISKSLDKVLENLGFVRGLRKTFFDINKTSIRFKTPVRV